MNKGLSVKERQKTLATRLAAELEEALSEAETTDFRRIDDLIFEGVSTGQLRDLPREQIHRQLVFALSETVLEEDSMDSSKNWILDAVRLFLRRTNQAAA
jgi:hypothetical protein